MKSERVISNQQTVSGVLLCKMERIMESLFLLYHLSLETTKACVRNVFLPKYYLE